jgi:hypothetical protein
MPELNIGRLTNLAAIAKAVPLAPKQNSCVYLGPGSLIKTELPFQAFFDKDHTIAAWFMPQYARGGHGPLFASSGPSRYFVGQGDYRAGNALLSVENLAPGVSPKEGYAVLTIFAGSQKKIYLAAGWKAGVWQHLAVVRMGGVLSLYLNGAKLPPVQVTVHKDANGAIVSKTAAPTSELEVPASVGGGSLGLLQLGRSMHPTLTAYAQAYGLLDDVAVFDHALPQTELTALFTKKRLAGYEKGMVAGWGFDTPLAGNLLPAKLSGEVEQYDIAGKIKISSDRNSAEDKSLIDLPLVYAKSTPIVKFPFPKGEAWKVVQGYCNPTGSHNGDAAAFCYDLVLASGSSANMPVYASEGGFVYQYLRNGTVKEREPNRVILYNEVDGVVVSYLHLAGNSLTPEVVDGDPPAADPDAWVVLWPQKQRMVYGGTKLGLVGPKAKHLHWSGKEVVVDPQAGLSVELSANGIPMAFKEIEVKSPGETDFHGILGLYVPKEGDIIRAI